MDKAKKIILVVSATGVQGRVVVKTLLQNGFNVRIFVRNPDSPVAQELIKAGAEPVKGDLKDPASLEAAVEGVDVVYSILPFDDPTLELNGGLALIKAALKANVQQFVHASVSNAGTHTSFPRWGTGYWNEPYWTTKWAIEEAIHKAGFPYWTILKPVAFMENYISGLADIVCPKFKEGKLITAQDPTKKWDLVTVEDTAKFALEAIKDRERFNKKSIEIASDSLTNDEVAAVFTKVLGKKFEAVSLSLEEAVQNGLHPMIVRTNEWSNETGGYFVADKEALKEYKIPLTSFEEWVTKHKDEFKVKF